MFPEEKFKQIYNPKSNRLQNYDYSSNGGYFITICTKNREHYFGEIIDRKMILNEIGKIVEKYYLETPKHFPFVILDEFVIMPNHLHFVIFIIDDKCMDDNNNRTDVALQHLYDNNDNNDNNNRRDVALQHLYDNNDKFTKEYYSNISPKKGELGTIIRSLKSVCTKIINKFQDKIFFAWQSNYYDRIIRNEDELQRIRKYILENPLKWELDKNNTENIFM